MATVRYFPCPSRARYAVNSSFYRKYIPTTTTKYARAKTCCLPNCAGHGGNDVGGSVGLALAAVWDGIIRLKSFGPAYGYQLTVVAADGHGAFYAHMSAIGVREGQRVRAGQYIGRMGRTGQTSGAHLHFEHRRIWTNWCTAIDPWRELEAARKAYLAAH